MIFFIFHKEKTFTHNNKWKVKSTLVRLEHVYIIFQQRVTAMRQKTEASAGITFAMLGHELKNKLVAIDASISTLKKRLTPGTTVTTETAEKITHLHEKINRMYEITSIFRSRKVILQQSKRSVTPFGGISVFFEFLSKLGYAQKIAEHMPFQLKSPKAIDPVHTFTAFIVSVLIGARGFAHTGLFRIDKTLHTLLESYGFPTTIQSGI